MEGKWSTLRVEVEHSVGDFVYQISNDWMINLVVLVSMMVQLLLAFGGALRYRSGSSVLQLVIWLGYMSADAVAIYALGVMAHTQSRALFGIWAPILLSHLGGPDTISAYSSQDNELWLRHLLTMLYQISVAAYVVYLVQLGGYLLAAALLLLIVGISKYAERTMALRSSSLSQIVSSADPMNVLMQQEGRRCNYLVMGLQKWRKSGNVMVTINDVWNSEGKVATENYLLCLSHALFKMNKRRYVNLYLHERFCNTTRDFYFAEELSHIASPQKIFAVAEMELKFLYDLLFSKSSGTAFSKVGTVMRLVNICLLGITRYLLYSELSTQRVLEETLSAQRMVCAPICCSSFRDCAILQNFGVGLDHGLANLRTHSAFPWKKEWNGFVHGRGNEDCDSGIQLLPQVLPGWILEKPDFTILYYRHLLTYLSLHLEAH